MALATSLSTEKMSLSLRSNVSAQRCESLAALINCTFTRTASPLFCTLPSRMCAPASCFAMSDTFAGALLYCRVDVREITFRSAIFDEFFEARIIPQRMEHWIEPEQCRSKRSTRTKRARICCHHKFLKCGDGA